MRISDWSSDVCSSDLSTSGAGYASTARGSRLAGAGGALAATGLLLAALWIGLAVREHVAPDSALRVFDVPLSAVRSEERRVGKECVSQCRSRWSPDH